MSKVLEVSLERLNGEELLNLDSKLTNSESNLLENFNKLNDLGKNKLIEYSNDLIKTPKYIKINNNVTDLTTATKEEFLENRYTTLAAHDDDLTEDEKKNANRRIIEELRRRQK